MLVPLSWLREYVDVDIPPQELAHRLTMAGIEVDDVVERGGWKECYVAEVLDVRPHPNADRLSLCRVNANLPEEMEVVCGAPNVAAGQKVCFARAGAYLYNTHSGQQETLRPARIRGVESQGMICSEIELGLGEGHEGIIVLPEDAPVGIPLDQYLGDTILDLELTPNRLDCLSILGVAHEVAALLRTRVREPEVSYDESGPPVDGQVSISIADPDLCRRYTASVIRGISLGESPQWLQDRLIRAGLRPINNVVDVTNYVMLEYNQPLHAFDLDTVQENTVIVRRAKIGETLETLDGVQRKLTPEVLVIADARDPVGLGGVIGGANSEIGAGTTNVLLESATFDAYNNRQTAETFGLRTEATLRFEKGLRPELAPIALRRATQLIQQVAGGQVARGIVDIFPDQGYQAPVIELTTRRLAQVLGMEMDLPQIEGVMDALGFDSQRKSPHSLEVTVPYWRNDVNIEEDLIEEVVRIVGYDEVPTTMLSTPIPYHRQEPRIELRDRIKDALAAAGMQEVISYPLVTLDGLEKVNQLDPDNPPLRIANPLSAGQEYLRHTLRASLLETLAANEGHSEGPFRLFEVGRAFLPRPDQLPDEREVAAGVMAGRRWNPSWLAEDGLIDFFDAKGVVDSALERLGVTAEYEPAEDPSFHPGRCARIMVGGSNVGTIGEVHPAIRRRFDLNSDTVVLFELDLAGFSLEEDQSPRRFTSLSRFPAATRDLALVVQADVPAGQVRDIISRHRLVVQAELFDVYAGDNIAEGSKSLAFHVYFQSPERTLTAEEVNRSLEGLLRVLGREVGATLRS